MKQASEGPAAGAAWRFRFTLPPSLPQPPVRGIGRGKPPGGPGKFFRFPSRLFSSSSSSPWRLPTCALGQSVSVGPAPSPWPRVGAGPPPPPREVRRAGAHTAPSLGPLRPIRLRPCPVAGGARLVSAGAGGARPSMEGGGATPVLPLARPPFGRLSFCYGGVSVIPPS